MRFYRNWDEIIAGLKRAPAARRVVLVGAHDERGLEALRDAARDGLARPILVGDRFLIEPICRDLGWDLDPADVYHEPEPEPAVSLALALIKEGAGDFLMNGAIKPALLLEAVAARPEGLGRGRVLSYVAWLSLPHYHKMLAVTDCAVNPYPDLEEKRQIIDNVVEMLTLMGYSRPLVAALAGVEWVDPRLPETGDAAALKEMNRLEIIDDCLVEGPISMDLTFSPEKARLKKYHSPVVGEADVLLAPNLSLGNCLSKALAAIGGADLAGVVLGALAPVVMATRASSKREKYLSIVMAAAMLSLGLKD